jgi:hypothetical protein
MFLLANWMGEYNMTTRGAVKVFKDQEEFLELTLSFLEASAEGLRDLAKDRQLAINVGGVIRSPYMPECLT